MSAASIPVVVGIDECGVDVVVDPLSDGHLLVAGQTRSGKSSLAYAYLGGLKAAGAPVRVVGVDPSKVLLKTYETDPLVALGTSPDQVMAVLDGVLKEIDDRLNHLAEKSIDRLQTADRDMPVMIVVVDEYAALMNSIDISDRGLKVAERMKPKIEAAVDTIVATGAKVLVKAAIFTQRASASVISTDSRANFSTRVSFRVDDDESLKMLFPAIQSELVREMQSAGPGAGLVKSIGAPIRRFRADHVTYGDYTDIHQESK